MHYLAHMGHHVGAQVPVRMDERIIGGSLAERHKDTPLPHQVLIPLLPAKEGVDE
jgi:hypothetical protein